MSLEGTTSGSGSPQPNLRYWLSESEGTQIVQVENYLYKINEPSLATLNGLPIVEIGEYKCIQLPLGWDISFQDFEALLDHLQKPSQQITSPSFADVTRLLQISAPDRLNVASIHSWARDHFSSMFPSTPAPNFKSDHAEEALVLALKYNIASVQKQLYYTLVTTSNIGTEDHAEDLHPLLDATLVKRCKHLLTSIIDHFAPILFTVSTASHMACTDVFAEQWMPLVIAPSLVDGGVSQPIETLQNIIDVDWKSLGICEECILEKEVEWRGEMDVVWEKMDGWLQAV